MNNRLLFLGASVSLAVFRIAFIVHGGHTWKLVLIGFAGFSRGMMLTPLPLVVSERYKEQFATAFSVFNVISGCISLFIGVLAGYIKAWTNSDAMIIYVFAAFNFICCFLWILKSFLRKYQ
ncbi:hypothetical protein JTB14_012484 [Gonioctena quinquepunctata]|nr:hypothetical protein JTB14_012484 [Gonioctena quinquepunctata]